MVGRGLVERQAEPVRVDEAQIDAGVAGGDQQLVGAAGDRQGQRVEEGLVDDLDADGAQGAGQDGGQAVHAARDPGQALRPVPDGVEAGDHRQQHLGGADVAGRLVAADMLLAGLQRHAQGGLAAAVDRDADDPAGHGALVGFLGREERGVRPAIAHRHAEALGRAQHDVGAELAGRGQERQRQEIAGDDGEAALGLDGGDGGAQVADAAVAGGVLQQRAEHGLAVELGQGIARDQLDALMAGAGLQHGQRLRMHAVVDEEQGRLAAADPVRHGHGLGGGGGLVEQRGVGQLHAGEVDHHLLVVEHGFEPALADLGLVGRVGRVPAGAFQHVAQDHRRGVGAVIAHADHRGGDAVAVRHRPQRCERLGLGAGGRQGQRPVGADRGRDDARGQLVERAGAHDRQHGRQLVRAGAEMAVDERVAGLGLDPGRARHGQAMLSR